MENFLLIFPVLLFSIVVHEVAHGWVALKQGDPTAQSLGRITLNPIPHIDPFGSIILPLILLLAPGGLLFGWAKPVPVDPRNFRNYRRGDILVSLAGVTSNLILAALFTLLVIALVHVSRAVPAITPSADLLTRMLSTGVWLNLLLAFFNLIPIPPLDGSHVLYHLLPPRLGAQYRQVGQYGFLILMGVLMFAPRIVSSVFLWPASVLNNLAETLIRLWT